MKWPGHQFALGLFATVIVVWLAVMIIVMRQASLPDSATGIMLVVFEPSTPSETAFAAITRAGAKPIRQTAFGFIWVVDGNAGKLKTEGAMGSYKELPISPEVAGCVAVVNEKVASAFAM
jgi:hypothetical protein